jgi:hypothetical protein
LGRWCWNQADAGTATVLGNELAAGGATAAPVDAPRRQHRRSNLQRRIAEAAIVELVKAPKLQWGEY